MIRLEIDKGAGSLLGLILLVTIVAGLLFGGALARKEECASPPDGMISWWIADTHALDVAGGNHGIEAGVTYAAGMADGAFSFDGQHDYVSIQEGLGPPLDGLSSMSIEAWIYPDSYGWPNPEPDSTYDAAILGKYDSTDVNGASFLFMLRDGRPRLVVYGQGAQASVIADDEISLAQWSHVAGVWWGADQLELYVNGSVVPATISTSGMPLTTADSLTPIEIGRANSYSGTHTGPAAYFDGLIDEVTVYGRALEPAEISSIYSALGKCKDSFRSGRQFLPLLLKTLPTPTPGPYPFAKSETSPLYLQNFNGLGCDWMGVAGEVLDSDGHAFPAGIYNIHVWGNWIDDRIVAGSNLAYGPSGWEVTLADAPVVRVYEIQMETLAGAPLSQVYEFSSRASCNQNLVIFNFVGQQ